MSVTTKLARETSTTRGRVDTLPRLRVHFENLPTKPPVFHITEQRLSDAQHRYADIAKQLAVSRGEDIPTLCAMLPEIQVLVTSYDVLSNPSFPLNDLARAAPNLQWILLTSAGIEKLLPLNWLPQKTKLINARGAHRKKASEFAQMSLLMLNAQVPRMVTNQRKSHWDSIFTPIIAGKRLCILGAGNLGSAFAREGKRLGMTVVGTRRTARPHPHFDEVHPLSDLRKILSGADFVVSTLPLTHETKTLIGTPEFAAMKKGVGFMNVGRGGVIDHAALCAALTSGHIANAILDVYPAEPLPSEDALWQTPNLIMIPHVAMDDVDQFLPICLDLAFSNLKLTLAGRPLKNVVRPQLGY